MKKLYFQLILIITILFLTGCVKTDYQIYKQNPTITNNTSIVLLGIKGEQKVNYLQFMSDKMPPALNYKFSPISNNIIALKVNTPQKNYQFGVFTTGNAGYVTAGSLISSYGYIAVQSKPININKKGVYFFGTLNTDTNTINQEINQTFLENAKQKYKSLLKELEPINFNW